MPYQTLKDLPEGVRRNLPTNAKKIYKSVFNSAWEDYSENERAGSREEYAHRVAWSAVKNKYSKNGEWHLKGGKHGQYN